MGLGNFLKNIFDSAEREVKSRPLQQRPQPQPEPKYEESFSEVPNYTEAQWINYFKEILTTEFAPYSFRENVPVQELAGDVSAEFHFYENRPYQVYRAEWGHPYTFVLFENGMAKGVLYLGKTQNQYKNVKVLISKMYAKKIGLPFITFYMDAPNERNYVIERIHKFLG